MAGKLGCVVVLTLVAGAYAANWGYGQDEHGPDHWGSEYSTCEDKKQSPIDFKSTDLKYKSEMPLMLEGWGQDPKTVKLINNGHTAKIEWNTEYPVYMYGGGLCTAYKLAQMHIHWGSNSTSGSEHTLNGASFPAEFHFVHYKAEHKDLTEALVDPKEDTLAVLGVWAKLSPVDNPKLNRLFKSLEKIEDDVDKAAMISNFPVEDLIPEDLTSLYRYKGSLTTPACNEIVTWTVAVNTIPISERQLKMLRTLKQKNGSPMVNNYRPVQPLNGREVSRITTYSLMMVESGSMRLESTLMPSLFIAVFYMVRNLL